MTSPDTGTGFVKSIGPSYRSFISGLFGTTRKSIDRELGFDPFAIGSSFAENLEASFGRGMERFGWGTGGERYERPESRGVGYAGPRVDTAAFTTERKINSLFPDSPDIHPVFTTNEGEEFLNPTYQDVVNSPSGGTINFNTTLDKLDQRFKDVGISPEDIFTPPDESFQDISISNLPPTWEQTHPMEWNRNEKRKKLLSENHDIARILQEKPAKYASEEAASRANDWEGRAYDEQVWGLIKQPTDTVTPYDADDLIQKLHSNLNDFGVTHRENIGADLIGGFGGRIAGFMGTLGGSEHYATGPYRSEEGLETLADNLIVLDIAGMGALGRQSAPYAKTLKPYLRAVKSQILNPNPSMPDIPLGGKGIIKTFSEASNPFSNIKSHWRSFKNIIDYNPTINRELINESTLKFHEVLKNTGATDQEADILMRFMGNRSMKEYGDPQEIFRKTTVELGASDDSLGVFRTDGTDQYFDIKHIYTPGGNKRYFKVEGGEEILQRAASEDTTVLQDKLVISNLQEAFQFEKTRGKTFLSKKHLLGVPGTNNDGLLGETKSAAEYESIGLKISKEELDITGIREHLEEFPDGTRFSLDELEKYAATNRVHIVKHEAYDHWGEVNTSPFYAMDGYQEDTRVVLYAFDFDNAIGERSKFSTDRVAAILNPWNEPDPHRVTQVRAGHYRDIRFHEGETAALGEGGYIPREIGTPVTEGAQPWRADTRIDEDIYLNVRTGTRPFYALDGSTILKADIIEEIQSDWIQNMDRSASPEGIYRRMQSGISEHWFTKDNTNSGYRFTHITNSLQERGEGGAYREINNPSFIHNQKIFTISPINESGETNIQTQFDLITGSLDEAGFRRNDEIGKILHPTPSEREVIFTLNNGEILRTGLDKSNIQIGPNNTPPSQVEGLIDDLAGKMGRLGMPFASMRSTPFDDEKAFVAIRIKGGDQSGHQYIEVTTGYRREYYPGVYDERANINLIGSNHPNSLDPKVNVLKVQIDSEQALNDLMLDKLLGRRMDATTRVEVFDNFKAMPDRERTLYSRDSIDKGNAGFKFRGNRDGTWAAYDGPLKISPDMDNRDAAVDYIGRKFFSQSTPDKPLIPEDSFFKKSYIKQGGMFSLQNSARRGRSGLLISTAEKIRSRYPTGAPHESYKHNHQLKPSIQAAINDPIVPFDAVNRDNRREGSVMKGLLQGISGVLRGNGYDYKTVSPGAINKSELVSVRKVLIPADDPLGTSSMSYKIVPSNEESYKLLEVLENFKADDLQKLHLFALPNDIKPKNELEGAVRDVVDYYWGRQDIDVNPIDALATRDVTVSDLIEHFGVPQHLLAQYTDVKPKQVLNSLARLLRDSVDPDADPIDMMEEIKLAPADTGGNGIWHHFIDLDVSLESLFGKAKDKNGNVLEHAPKTLGDILRNQPIRQYKTRPELGNTQGKVMGHVDIYNDGRSVITAMESANFGTMVHEVGHIFRRFLSNTELELIGRSVMGDVGWEALPDKRIWTIAGEENFANALEAYITQGRYKKGMDTIFDKFIVWIRNLFRGSRGNKDLKINKTLSDFFDEFIDTSRPTEKHLRDNVPAHNLASHLDFWGYDSGTLRGIPVPSGVKRPGDVVPFHQTVRGGENRIQGIDENTLETRFGSFRVENTTDEVMGKEQDLALLEDNLRPSIFRIQVFDVVDPENGYPLWRVKARMVPVGKGTTFELEMQPIDTSRRELGFDIDLSKEFPEGKALSRLELLELFEGVGTHLDADMLVGTRAKTGNDVSISMNRIRTQLQRAEPDRLFKGSPVRASKSVNNYITKKGYTKEEVANAGYYSGYETRGKGEVRILKRDAIAFVKGKPRPPQQAPASATSGTKKFTNAERARREQARLNGWDTYGEFRLSGFRRNEDVPLHELPAYAKEKSRQFKLDDEAWAKVRQDTKTLNEAQANLPWDQLDMWRRENPNLVDEALELLPNMNSMESIMNANNIVDSWEQIIKIPGLKEIARRFNPSAAATNPLFKAIYARFRMREQGEQLTIQTMSRLFKLGRVEKIFGGFDEKGRIADGPLKGFNVNDIRSNPTDPRWRHLLNDEQWVWIRTAEDIEKGKLRMMQAEGINIRLLPEEEGGAFRYAGRRAYALVSEDNEILDIVSVGSGPSRPGQPAGFMKERYFETEEDAIANGYRYFPDDEGLQMNVHAAYKRVADERFKNNLINGTISTRGASVPKAVVHRRDEATQYHNNVKALLRQLHSTKRGEDIHPSTLRSLKNHFPDIAGDLDSVSRVTLEHLVRAGEEAKGQPISFTPSKKMIEDIFVVVLDLESKVEFLQKSGMEVPQSLLKELADARKSKAFKLFARAQAYENFKNGKGFKYTYEKSARTILMAERDSLIDKLIVKVGGVPILSPEGKPTGKKHNGLIHKANKEMRQAKADHEKEKKYAFKKAREEGRALEIPAFSGHIFTKKQPVGLDGMTGEDVVKTLSKEIIDKQEFSKVLAHAQPMSAAYRFFSLGMDASLALIHLIFIWGESYTKPKLMGQVAKGYVASFLNPKYKYGLIDQNRELLSKYPDVILSGRQTETTDFIRIMQRGGWARYKPVKLAGKIITTPYQPFSRGVETALDAAGIELLKALDHLGTDAVQIREISDYVNEIRGLASSARLGVSKRQRQVEEISTLAARYNRAIVAMLADVFRPEAKLPRIGRPIDTTKSLRPQLARRSLLRGSSFIAMMTVAIGLSQGEDIEEIADHFNPTSPMFLTWNVHGQNIGIGSKMRSIIKLDAEIAMAIYQGKTPTLFDVSMDNPMVRFVRGNFGYFPAQTATILSGSTYMGDRVHTLPWIDLKPGQERMTPVESGVAFAKHVFPGPLMGPIWGKSAVLEGGNVDQRAVRASAEFFGGRGYPEGGYQIVKQFAKDTVGIDYEDMRSFERKILRDILAKDLDPLQQKRLEQGDKNSLYWAGLDSLDQERYEKEVQALKDKNARTGRYRDNANRELRRAFSEIQDTYSDQRHELNRQFDMYQEEKEYDPDDPGKFVMSEWYETYEEATDSSGLINFDRLKVIQGNFWKEKLPDGTPYSDFFGRVRMETLTTSHPEGYRRELKGSTVQNYDLAHESRMRFLKDRGNWHVVLDQYGLSEQDLSIWK